MRTRAKRNGLGALIAPLRPPDKAREPFVPMGEYAQRLREDGLPEDRWLRVHARLGAVVVGVAMESMVVVGTLDRWREWTGKLFDTDGPVEVSGGLVPVVVSCALDLGVYVEPNV